MANTTQIDMFDALLYAAAPYAGKHELQEYNSADPAVKMTEQSKKRILKRLHKEKKFRERHEVYRPAWEFLKRVSVWILVVLSISFISAMSIEAVRTALWEAILDWKEEYIHLWYENDDPTANPLSVIEEYREPRAIGDEFVRYEGIKNEYNYKIEYESAEVIISYSQGLLGDDSMYISNEDTELVYVNIYNMPGIIAKFESNGVVLVNLSWYDQEYMYNLFGNISIDEIIEIAESVE